MPFDATPSGLNATQGFQFSPATQAAIATITKTIYQPSVQQSAVINFVVSGKGSAIVDAKAGAGKTSTLKMLLLAIPENKDVTLIAFSKLIARDLNNAVAELRETTGRAFAKVRVTTFHAHGLNALRYRFKNLRFDDKTAKAKISNLISNNFNAREIELYESFATKLVHFAKCQGIGVRGMTDDTIDAWQDIVQHHAIMLDSFDATEAEGIEAARKLLALSNKAATKDLSLDYDDLLYIPLLLNIRFYSVAYCLVDEGQDINPARLAMCERLVMPSRHGTPHTRFDGRLIVVGDPNQAIFGFTGAMHDSLDQVAARFNAVTFPLSVCYRCSAAVVAYAQEIVPTIQAAPGAPEGIAAAPLAPSAIATVLTAADAILCRNVAPLVSLAYAIIRNGQGCKLLGRDIGAGLAKLVKSQKAKTLISLDSKLAEYAAREITIATAAKDTAKVESINDRVECVRTISGNLPAGATVADLISKIESMFVDDNDESPLLTLATIHKVKGKEYPQVALLRPELIPSKYATQDWQIQQEMNLDYVWRTRAKLNSYIIG